MFVIPGSQPVINVLGRLVYWATAVLKSLDNLFGYTLADTSKAQSGLASSSMDTADAIDEQAKEAKKARNAMIIKCYA